MKFTEYGLLETNQLDMSYSSRHIFSKGPWLAPEYLTPKRIAERSEKGDIYSFGVVLWELITRKLPWNEMAYMEVIQNVSKGEKLDIPSHCTEGVRELLNDCWNDGNVAVVGLLLIV